MVFKPRPRLAVSDAIFWRGDFSGLDPSGQLWFDFEEESLATVPYPKLQTADDWFDEALALEDEGRRERAAAAYRRAIQLDPHDPVL